MQKQYDSLFCIINKCDIGEEELLVVQKRAEQRRLQHQVQESSSFFVFDKKDEDVYVVTFFTIAYISEKNTKGETVGRRILNVDTGNTAKTIQPSSLGHLSGSSSILLTVPRNDNSPAARLWLHPRIIEHLLGNKKLLPNCDLAKLFAPLSEMNAISKIDAEDHKVLIDTLTEETSRRTYPCIISRPPLAVIGEFKSGHDETFLLRQLHQPQMGPSEFIQFMHPITANAIPILTMYSMYVSLYMLDKSKTTVTKEFREKLIACYDWYWSKLKSCLSDSLLPTTRDIQAMPIEAPLLDFVAKEVTTPRAVWTKFDNLNREYVTRLLHIYEVALIKLGGVETYKDETDRRECNAQGYYLSWPASEISFGKPQNREHIKKTYLRGCNPTWMSLLSPITSDSMPVSVAISPSIPMSTPPQSPPIKDIVWSIKHKICLIQLQISKFLVKEQAIAKARAASTDTSKKASLSESDERHLKALTLRLVEWHNAILLEKNTMLIRPCNSTNQQVAILPNPLGEECIKHLLLYLWTLDVHLAQCGVIEI